MKKKFPIIVAYFSVGVALAGIVSYSAVQEAYRNRKIEAEVQSLQKQARDIQNENDSLSAKIAYFETPEFQEKIAKEKLNLQKPDENVIVVKPGAEQTQVPAVKVNGEKEIAVQIPNYKKWLNFFFKYN